MMRLLRPSAAFARLRKGYAAIVSAWNGDVLQNLRLPHLRDKESTYGQGL